MFGNMRSIKRLFVFVSVALLVLALNAAAAPADARFSSCSGDPIVFLSNGDHVQVTATMGTSEANVKSISYTLHAPPGVKVDRVLYTGGPLSGKETFKFYADASPNQYSTDTVVFTSVAGVNVTATTALKAYQLSGSATGFERQHLQVTLRVPQGNR